MRIINGFETKKRLKRMVLKREASWRKTKILEKGGARNRKAFEKRRLLKRRHLDNEGFQKKKALDKEALDKGNS